MWLYPGIIAEFKLSSCSESTNTSEQEKTLITDGVETEMFLLVWFVVVEAQMNICWVVFKTPVPYLSSSSESFIRM